jgi:hypothetical protein
VFTGASFPTGGGVVAVVVVVVVVVGVVAVVVVVGVVVVVAVVVVAAVVVAAVVVAVVVVAAVVVVVAVVVVTGVASGRITASAAPTVTDVTVAPLGPTYEPPSDTVWEPLIHGLMTTTPPLKGLIHAVPTAVRAASGRPMSTVHAAAYGSWASGVVGSKRSALAAVPSQSARKLARE